MFEQPLKYEMSYIDPLEALLYKKENTGYRIDGVRFPAPLLGVSEFSGNIMTVQAYRTINSTLVQKVRANLFKTVWEYPALSDYWLRNLLKIVGQKRVTGVNVFDVTFQSPFAWKEPSLITVKMYLGSELQFSAVSSSDYWVNMWSCRLAWVQVNGGLAYEGVDMATGLPTNIQPTPPPLTLLGSLTTNDIVVSIQGEEEPFVLEFRDNNEVDKSGKKKDPDVYIRPLEKGEEMNGLNSDGK